MNHETHVLILGGGYAGMAAALRLARVAPAGTSITLVDGNDGLTERVRLHQVGAGQEVDPIPRDELLEGTGVGFLPGWVRRIDPVRRRVLIGDRSVAYDRLIVALGSRVDRRVPGAADHAVPLHGADRARKLAEVLDGLAAREGTVSIVGGGLTGIELASELAEAHPGLRLRLVAERVAAGVSPGAERHLRRILERMNVTLEERGLVEEVGPDRLTLGPDRVVKHDLCVWAAGFVASSLAAAAGMAVNGRNQMLLDPYLRSSSHPGIYGAGDAGTLQRRNGAEHLMSCRLGIPMAVQAADNLARELRGKAPRPWVVRDNLRCISLGRHDGVVQVFTPLGRPTRLFITGRLAAWIKERIVRSTVATLRLLSKQARWSGGPGGRRPALAAAIRETSSAAGPAGGLA